MESENIDFEILANAGEQRVNVEMARDEGVYKNIRPIMNMKTRKQGVCSLRGMKIPGIYCNDFLTSSGSCLPKKKTILQKMNLFDVKCFPKTEKPTSSLKCNPIK